MMEEKEKSSSWGSPVTNGNGEGDKKKKERVSLAARLKNFGEQRRFSLGEQRRETGAPSPVSTPFNVQQVATGNPVQHPSLDRTDSIQELISGGSPFLRGLITAFRRLMGANRQLCVVSKYATEAAKGKDDLKILLEQLDQARVNLDDANTDLSDKLRRAAKVQTHQVIMDLINFSATISNTSSFLINCCKSVTVELGDRHLFKQVMTATRTVRDALTDAAEALKDAPTSQQNPDMEKRLLTAASTAKQSLWQLVTAQAAVVGENLIPLVRKQEILAAIRAAVCATTKLVWVRSTWVGGIEISPSASSGGTTTLEASGDLREGGEIVESAKIAATTVGQLSAALLEAANSDLMLAHPQYQQLLIASIDRLKAAVVALLEETRTEVFVDPRSASPAYEEMREAIVHSAAVTDMLSQQSLEQLGSDVPGLTRKHTQDARKVVEANTPPPPIQSPAPPVRGQQAAAGEKEEQGKEKEKDCQENGKKDDVAAPPEDPSRKRSIWEEPEDCPENVRSREDDPTRLRCANLNKLIEKLTSPGSPDMKMIKTFITTYQSYTTANELLNKLIERYHVPKEFAEVETPIQLRVCNIFRFWVERYLYDFTSKDIRILSRFVEKKLIKNQTTEKYAKRIQTMLEMRRASNVRETVRKGLVEIKVESKIPLSPAKVLSVFNELQIARQLTLVEFNLYKAIRPVELLNQAWNKAKLKHRAPNLLRMIARSTSLSMWVASCILWQPTLKDRIRVLTKMINIAEHLRQMNNFHTLMAMIAGINTTSIFRLKHTRDGVPAQTMKTFEACEALMSSNNAFQNYRKELHNINPPCVPFIGVYLTDLTFADDANPDYIDGLINFAKWERIYTIIGEIQQYQQTPYEFEYVDHIASFLSELPLNTEEDMFNISKFYEPKDSLLADIL